MKLARSFTEENTDMNKIRTELVLNHNVFKDDAKLKKLVEATPINEEMMIKKFIH